MVGRQASVALGVIGFNGKPVIKLKVFPNHYSLIFLCPIKCPIFWSLNSYKVSYILAQRLREACIKYLSRQVHATFKLEKIQDGSLVLKK